MLAQKGTVGEGSGFVGKHPAALAPGQIATLIGIGLTLWFAAALTVRFGAPAGLFGPTASVIIFALSLPFCWLAVLVSK